MSNSSSSARSRRLSRRPRQSTLMRPPQLSPLIQVSKTYRFRSTNGTATPLTAESLLCAAGCMGVIANTTLYSVWGAVRVVRISIWSPPPEQGSVTTCSLLWESSAIESSVQRVDEDTSNSVSAPAMLSRAPPVRSLASFWNQASTDSIVTVTAPTGSIIDIALQLQLLQGGAPASTTVAVGDLGFMYFTSADSNATHYFVPTSLTTTT